MKDFIVPNNAGEDFCGSDDVRHDDMMYDMMYDIQLQFGGEREMMMMVDRFTVAPMHFL